MLFGIRFLGGHTVAQLADAMPYKLKGCGFYSQLCHRNFSSHTMVQGSVQTLTELSTRNISRVVKATCA